MTTIVAVKDPQSDQVVMASDTAFYGGNTFLAHGDKFIHRGRCGFGSAGRAIYDDWVMQEPEILDGEPTAYELRTRLGKLFERHGAKPETDQEGLPRWGLAALYVRAPEIYAIDAYMCITRLQGFGAVGSGQDYALGAMHSMWDGGTPAKWVAQNGIMAAMALDAWTAGDCVSKVLKQ